MTNQLVIKILLIAGFAIVGLILVLPRQGTRDLAIRRLATLLLIVVAVFAVIFPEWLSRLAALVGVGRGTDLVLYVLVVLFFGHSVTEKMRSTALSRQLTELARSVAISPAPDPATAVPVAGDEPRPDSSGAQG